MDRGLLGSYRGPRDGDDAIRHPDSVDPRQLIAAHQQLASRRRPGETAGGRLRRRPRRAGPALQVVTDEATMLLDSVAVLLHRLGVPYTALMAPVFASAADADGRLCSASSRDRRTRRRTIPESWIHVQLTPTADRRALAEAERLLPMVLADARQVAEDSAALSPRCSDLADTSGRRRRLAFRRTGPCGRRGAAALAGRRPFRAARSLRCRSVTAWPWATSPAGWGWPGCAPSCCPSSPAR